MSHQYYQDQLASPSWGPPRPSWDRPQGNNNNSSMQERMPMRHVAEQQQPEMPSRFPSQMSPDGDNAAFRSQIDEVERAIDNLVKSGKLISPAGGRRDSMPMLGGPRGFPPESPHIGVGTLPARLSVDSKAGMLTGVRSPAPRHYSMSEYQLRSPSSSTGSNLQNYYAMQRQMQQPALQQQPSPDKVIESKRLAAQRERELRNYHQEQQYNRLSNNSPGLPREPGHRGPLAVVADMYTAKGASPNLSEEEQRRDLINSQRRVLYNGANGEGAQLEDGHYDDVQGQSQMQGHRGSIQFGANGASAPASNQGGTRGPSPMGSGSMSGGFDPFGQQNGQNGNMDHGQVQSLAEQAVMTGSHSTGAVSPKHARTSSGSPPGSASFSLSDNAGFNNRTTASSPGGSPPRSQRGSIAQGPPGVAPIGTRPTSQVHPAMNSAKRSTTPLPSPLSYSGFNTETDPFNNNAAPKERSASAASNEQHSASGVQGSDGLGWSKVWGPSKRGMSNNVASVWG